MGNTSNQSESITALRLLKGFLSAICETVDRDGWLILRDPVLRAEVAIPARQAGEALASEGLRELNDARHVIYPPGA